MTLEKKKLNDYLKHAKRITKGNSLSVLNNIVISVKNNELYLECTDLQYYFEAALPFFDNGFGIDSFVFPKTLFTGFAIYEAVKACKGKEIEITLNNGCLYFGDIVLPVSDIDYSKFPENPFSKEKITSSGTIERMDTFKRAFEFISSDETRYFMNGVHFVLVDGKLRFESTDGRTALQSDLVMGKSKPVTSVDYIVRDISKFIPLNMNHFETTYKMIEYSNDVYRLSVSHIDGQFPNISRVIPDLMHYEKLIFDRISFVKIIKEMSLLFKMKGFKNKSKINVSFDNVEIRKYRNSETAIDYAFDLPIKTSLPEGTHLSFSFEYLNMMINREHDFEIWHIKNNVLPLVIFKGKNTYPEKAVCIVDKVFITPSGNPNPACGCCAPANSALGLAPIGTIIESISCSDSPC